MPPLFFCGNAGHFDGMRVLLPLAFTVLFGWLPAAADSILGEIEKGMTLSDHAGTDAEVFAQHLSRLYPALSVRIRKGQGENSYYAPGEWSVSGGRADDSEITVIASCVSLTSASLSAGRTADLNANSARFLEAMQQSLAAAAPGKLGLLRKSKRALMCGFTLVGTTETAPSASEVEASLSKYFSKVETVPGTGKRRGTFVVYAAGGPRLASGRLVTGSYGMSIPAGQRGPGQKVVSELVFLILDMPQ